MFIKNNHNIERKTVNNYAHISKKFDEENFEINVYEMKKGGSFYLTPPENLKGYKSYLIVKGQISEQETQNIYESGDILLLKSTDDYVIIDIIEDATLYLTTSGGSSYKETEKRFEFANQMLEEIQKKDDYTNQHCFRVFSLAKDMAPYLELHGKMLYAFLTAARYHDLGKISVSDRLLKKPGQFTEHEFISMKDHVLETRRLLESVVEEEVCLIAEQHHERLNGSGYPYGLKTNEISELGKALAVIDTFDAMTTDRVYKKGKTITEAFKELYNMADSHYERTYIDLLEKIVKTSHT
jgi:HD-GYP domain-containing protein (c-di-GMP phosphodiesterase class II)